MLRKSLTLVLLASIPLFAQVVAKPKVTIKNKGTALPLAAPSVVLTCNAPTTGATPDQFRFYRATVAGGPYIFLGSVAACTFTDTTVQFGLTYYYVATSVNTATCPTGQSCESPYSNEAKAIIMANPIPLPPSGLTVTPTVAGAVELQWQQNGTYTGFRVYRKPSTRRWWAQVMTGLRVMTWTNSNLAAGSWDFEVRAVMIYLGKAYLSGPSNVVTVQVT